jgi:hypothetical protein
MKKNDRVENALRAVEARGRIDMVIGAFGMIEATEAIKEIKRDADSSQKSIEAEEESYRAAFSRSFAHAIDACLAADDFRTVEEMRRACLGE